MRAMGVSLVASDAVEDAGERLRQIREDLGLSQREVAHNAGTSQAQVVRIERGQTLGVSLRSIAEVADALGYRTEVVFTPYED